MSLSTRSVLRTLSCIVLLTLLVFNNFASAADPLGVKVGAASAELIADGTMIIGGGITGAAFAEQEGKLRVTAVVLEKPGVGKVVIASADVLFLTQDFVDPALAEIEKTTGIPAANVLVNATHTHHAPSTGTVHGYKRDEEFCRRVQAGIVKAVQDANARLTKDECTFKFALGEESSYGRNSRMLLSDNTIYWTGPFDDEVRPTGPFDPQLPVLAFLNKEKSYEAVIFNHSTHTIGSRKPGVRSPSSYGLTAQELEQEIGGNFLFLEGASGSTHNLGLKADEAIIRLKLAIRHAMGNLEPHSVDRLVSVKKPFKFKVRTYDEAVEDKFVVDYCKKRTGGSADIIIDVFKKQREVLFPQQGQERTTSLQAMVIGDVAIVGVPAEFFTQLGMDIKRRSPYRYTYVAELANDWIGYLPTREGHKLGGYQTWMGLQSYAEVGTGERVVDDVVQMLNELHAQ